MASSVPFVGPLQLKMFAKQYLQDPTFKAKINLSEHFESNWNALLPQVSAPV